MRFLSGGARVRLVAQMSMKKSQPLGLPDEEALLAEGLPASSPDGASLDPYVKVKFGKQVKETDWVKRNILRGATLGEDGKYGYEVRRAWISISTAFL